MLQLEVERESYYPGEIVRGRVHFTPRKDLTCVGVYVRFKAYEHSAWENENTAVTVDPNTAAVTTQALVHKGKRKHIFKFVKTLWGNSWGQSNKKVKLKSQSYSWPFAFELPKHIPPSLEYKKGRVRIEYVVKAHVKVPYNKSVKVTKMLSVGSVVQPKGTEIKDFELSKSSKWDKAMNLNKDSRFTLRATTKRQYTWPEDKFRFRLKIDNRTHTSFNSLVIRIQQYWKSGSLTEKSKLAKYKVTEGFPVEKATQLDRFIELPMPGRLSLVPTTNASLVSLSYHLIIEFHVGGLIKNPKIHIPIIVSSVPVIGSTPMSTPQGPVEDESQLQVSHAMPIDIDITTHQDISVEGPLMGYQEEIVQGIPAAPNMTVMTQMGMPTALPAKQLSAYPTAAPVTAQPVISAQPPPQPPRVAPIVNTYQQTSSYQQPKSYVPSSVSQPAFNSASSTAAYPSVPSNYPSANTAVYTPNATTNYTQPQNTSSYYPNQSQYTPNTTGHTTHHRAASMGPLASPYHDQHSYQGQHGHSLSSSSTANLYPNSGATSFNAGYNNSSAYGNQRLSYQEPSSAQNNYQPNQNTSNYNTGNYNNSYTPSNTTSYNTAQYTPNNTYYNSGQQSDVPPPLPKKSPPTPHNTSPSNTYNAQYQYPNTSTPLNTASYNTSGQYGQNTYQPTTTQNSYNNAATTSSNYAPQSATQYQPTQANTSYNSYQPNYTSSSTAAANTYPSSGSTTNYAPSGQLSRSSDMGNSTYSPPQLPLSHSYDSAQPPQRRLSKTLPPIPQQQKVNTLSPVPEYALHSNNSAYAEVPDDLPDDPDAVYDDSGVVHGDDLTYLNESFENIDIQDNEVLVVVVQDQEGGDFEEVFLSSPSAECLMKDIAETFNRDPSQIEKVIKLSNNSLVKRDEQVERLTVNEQLRVFWKY